MKEAQTGEDESNMNSSGVMRGENRTYKNRENKMRIKQGIRRTRRGAEGTARHLYQKQNFPL